MIKLAIVVAFLFGLILPASAQPVDERVEKIAELEHGGKPHCTTFSMNDDGSSWVTAAHCVHGIADLTIDGHEANVVLMALDGVDVAILSGPLSDGAFKVGPAPAVNAPVYSVGYNFNGESWGGPYRDEGRNIGRRIGGIVGKRIVDIVDFSSMVGSSGSPIIDENGDVVGIVTNGWRHSEMTMSPAYELFIRIVIGRVVVP